MRLQTGDRVIVADSGRCLVLENVGDGARMDLRIRGAEMRETPRTSDLGNDRPGRLHRMSNPKSAVADADWRVLDKRAAARDHLEPQAADKIVRAFDRDLTHLPVTGIEHQIAKFSD